MQVWVLHLWYCILHQCIVVLHKYFLSHGIVCVGIVGVCIECCVTVSMRSFAIEGSNPRTLCHPVVNNGTASVDIVGVGIAPLWYCKCSYCATVSLAVVLQVWVL